MAGGHEIDEVPEVPLLIESSLEGMKRTADAVTLLKSLGAYDDVENVIEARKLRAWKGKMRNRRHKHCRGLLVYGNDDGIAQAFRHLPGVDFCYVNFHNLLQPAAGGQDAVFWAEHAVSKLHTLR